MMVGFRRAGLWLWLWLPCLFFRIATMASFQDVGGLLEFRKGVREDESSCIAQTWDESKLDPQGCPQLWCGVKDCEGGFVTSLDLSGYSLSGEIRSSSLGTLTHLTSLLLSDNRISGPIPDDLGSLPHLVNLDLSHNLLNGSIPTSFGALSSLVNLSLASNLLAGNIPSFAALQYLSNLNLSHNLLTGNIPSGFSFLSVLDLHHNQLSGPVNPTLLPMATLKVLDLSSNMFRGGEIPWDELLQSLRHANLSNNALSGPLVDEKMLVIQADQLQLLDLSNNQLQGELPSFEYFYSLERLYLSNNLLSGGIPSGLFSTMSNLQVLDLSKNNFTGEIAAIVSQTLQVLNLSSNFLSGEIAAIVSQTLQVLNLSSNFLSGRVPSRLGHCMTVDLSNNKLYGDLSAMSSWTDYLEFVDLSINNLDGELPNTAAQLVRLSYFNVSHNTLSGSIPPQLGLLQKLANIDASFNQLTGALPSSLFNSSSLKYIALSNNEIIGSLPLLPFPSESTLESQLAELRLSNNKLSGIIPKEISSLFALELLDLSKNQFSGSIPNELGNSLARLLYLDLSHNQLTGNIPDTLPQSLEQLNLSYNQLTGTIPQSLSRFPRLSFFPGNLGLNVASDRRPESKGPQINFERPREGRGGMPMSAKAGLIGGCTAGITVAIALFLLLYYRSMHHSGNEEGGRKCYGIWGRNAMHFPFNKCVKKPIPPVMSFSADLLLANKRRSPAGKSRGGLSREIGDPWLQNNAMTTISTSTLEMPPKSSFSGLNVQLTEPSSQQQGSSPTPPPIVLQVQSPDRLAGDLHFLDRRLVFTAEELSRAPAEVLGRSSHGTSYKATLDNGHMLTVKWLREGLEKRKEDFVREAKKFGKIRHSNVISFRAYYWGPRDHEKLIISDYSAAESLSTFLDGQKQPPLSWEQRLGAIRDIGRGLVYLHCDRNMVHGNLKATNVFLGGTNSRLRARLADYSLHLLMSAEGTGKQILNAGALGYRAPELALMRKPVPSFKSDIYAFGVMMVEVLTGRSAGDIITGNCGGLDLTDWVRLLVSEGRSVECYDSSLVGGGREHQHHHTIAMDGVLALAINCTASQLSQRPNIRSVCKQLDALSSPRRN